MEPSKSQIINNTLCWVIQLPMIRFVTVLSLKRPGLMLYIVYVPFELLLFFPDSPPSFPHLPLSIRSPRPPFHKTIHLPTNTLTPFLPCSSTTPSTPTTNSSYPRAKPLVSTVLETTSTPRIVSNIFGIRYYVWQI